MQGPHIPAPTPALSRARAHTHTRLSGEERADI